MVIIITGASHTGKTVLAQKLLERFGYPYLSIDWLKMGLIRSDHTDLTPLDDDDVLTAYLWPIVREMIKTIIENDQNLIVEGCYVPPDWRKDFDPAYLDRIRFLCLVMSESFIRSNFADIQRYACAAEHRIDDAGCTMQQLAEDNARFLRQARQMQEKYILIEDVYDVDFDLE